MMDDVSSDSLRFFRTQSVYCNDNAPLPRAVVHTRTQTGTRVPGALVLPRNLTHAIFKVKATTAGT